jgi:hypothetical protein
MRPHKIVNDFVNGLAREIARSAVRSEKPARLGLPGAITSFPLVMDSRNSGMCGTGNRPDTGVQIPFTSRSQP